MFKFTIDNYALASKAARSLVGRAVVVSWLKRSATDVFIDESLSDDALVKSFTESCARLRLGWSASLYQVGALAAEMQNYATSKKHLYTGGDVAAKMRALSTWLTPEMRAIVKSAAKKAVAEVRAKEVKRW